MMIEQTENVKVDQEVLQCEKCGMTSNINDFYRYRDSEERYPVCKRCILSQLDIHNPDTFLWLLKELDIPYIGYEWDGLVQRYNNKSVLGRYLSKMKLKGFKAYKWEDSDELNERRHEQIEQAKRASIVQTSIRTFNPKPNDVVVWKFDINEFDPEWAAKMHKWIQENLPNNKVISMPNCCSLETISRKELEEILKNAGQN